MTKKHFAAIAAVIADELADNDGDPNAIVAVASVARGLADEFAVFNPNFDRVRFLSACGIDQ
jgi:hypothetical protein